MRGITQHAHNIYIYVCVCVCVCVYDTIYIQNKYIKFNIDTILFSNNGYLDFFSVQNPIKDHALYLVSYLFSFI